MRYGKEVVATHNGLRFGAYVVLPDERGWATWRSSALSTM
ncbi:hypothetical protein Pogu_0756 [Pyrobaculum oguniense TE7]|uniref:Uncharacterized protein n=1 Tax=Pyrobaculum oguniense (strain DSM 13380 / JCM 10595 / TE7) TaxID=698757 RepID=H6Q853_PYROT|nr:hypothetical protein Pogu_0756 [Pyrobaculum oguniense TE7]